MTARPSRETVPGMGERHHQQQYAVRMEWGAPGAAAICTARSYAVVVDVLRFTTAVSVAADAGTAVYPCRWRDASAAELARRHGATLAVSHAGPADGNAGSSRVSLSPASIRAAAGVTRVVLPSPNGSALACELTSLDVIVVAACLRNRTAVARWLAAQPPAPVAVVAAGERWPDGSLRPAAEDLWGAGAVIAALADLGMAGLSPEAGVAAAAFTAARPSLTESLLTCSSGRELDDRGLGADVRIAAELDASAAVPVLAAGCFAPAGDGRLAG